MGLFDRFRKREATPAAAPESAAAPEPAAEELPPDVIAIARRGMSTPPDDYMEAIVRADRPDGIAALRVGLSQPRWPANAEFMDSNVAAIARALAREHGIDPGKSTYLESQGPDGAEVIVVFMWR